MRVARSNSQETGRSLNQGGVGSVEYPDVIEHFCASGALGNRETSPDPLAFGLAEEALTREHWRSRAVGDVAGIPTAATPRHA
ncbi:hypothetical protein XAP412_130005 [Xanthomonas phaseoli pv. phaseoli]|uniref:Uncharacterized protein n=1 Tax=Xanthomonas campestris pv. phaseoli TaxID=317013 RepID=A0AB38DV60_XANCH|nr:hypothetical protein XAP6984_170005 [Xanthomonas phaseoli pv. phaseoli]SON79753.1 hypothetical protein XAP412_130005 [Xanthomonas phaseoli pv. phaseoli]SON81165.1 hypothetical protein XAP7430_120005 [Xanthomonas phaseoli pv. phaseoli]